VKQYELTYLLSPDLSELEIQAFSKKINTLLQEEGTEILKEAPITKIRLGYPIKKQRQTYLGVLSFNLTPERLEDLLKKIKSESSILRFFISTQKISKTKKETKPKVVRKIKIEPKLEKPSEEKKVDIAEIEKKLAEILGEI